MKLNKNFITHISGDDNMIVSSGASQFAGIVKGNETAGVIFECLKSDTTKEAIVDVLCEKFNAPKESVGNHVDNIVNKLREIGAIDD